MRKALLILNPKAGKRVSRTQIFTIADSLTREGWELTVYPTQCARDAERAARERGGDFDLLICSGGDGTMSETVSGVLQGGHAPILGYLPAGTTNDFAAALHLPRKPLEAMRVILNGTPAQMDAGCFNKERHFTYLAAFGLMTHVSYTTSQDHKNALGRAAYLMEGIKQLTHTQSYPMRVSSGRFTAESSYVLGLIANSTSFAGLIKLDEQNVLYDDGMFEVILVRDPGSPAALTRIILEIMAQRYDEEYVTLLRGSEITFESDTPIPWCLDGENGGEHSLAEIRNLKQAYTLMLPGSSGA